VVRAEGPIGSIKKGSKAPLLVTIEA